MNALFAIHRAKPCYALRCNEEEIQKDTERRAAILASLEWQYIVDDLSELSEVEVEQEHWETRYDSDAFKFTRPLALTAIGNTLGFWKPEQLGPARSTIGGTMGDLCRRPEFRCARSHVFRPLDDRFVRGMGAAAGRLINGRFLRFGRFNGANSSAKAWIYSFIR